MEDVDALKSQIVEIRKKSKRKVRFLWIMTIISFAFAFLFMLYGFTQAIEADRQRDLATTREQEVMAAEQETARAVEAKRICEELRNSNK